MIILPVYFWRGSVMVLSCLQSNLFNNSFVSSLLIASTPSLRFTLQVVIFFPSNSLSFSLQKSYLFSVYLADIFFLNVWCPLYSFHSLLQFSDLMKCMKVIFIFMVHYQFLSHWYSSEGCFQEHGCVCFLFSCFHYLSLTYFFFVL